MIRSSELPYAGTIVSSPTNSTFDISEPVPIEPLNLIGTVDSRHTNREPKSSTTIPQITRPTPGTRKVTSVRPQTGFRQTKLSTFLKTKSKFTCQFICVTSLILVPICIFIVIMIMSGDATV
uniref:Uncharacterized protein n=1 Tax=Rhabditophanes sp. KR3021 TaxID=114890 RepID=A0AC35UFK1_9BILA